MLEIDLKLMELCGKNYWFVRQQSVFIRQEEIVEEFKNFTARSIHNIYEDKWVKLYRKLNSIEIFDNTICFSISDDDDLWSPVFELENTYVVETEEEADKLVEELNKQKENANE